MHGICRLSVRWHQQFYHSTSRAGHQNCLATLIPSRHYRSSARGTKHQEIIPDPAEISNLGPKSSKPLRSNTRNATRSLNDNLVVREYEQEGSDKSTRRRIMPNRELVDEATNMRAQIQGLEQELKLLRQGPFGPQSEFMQSFPEDERERLLKALADEGVLPDPEEDALDMAEMDRLAEEDKDAKMTDSLAVTLRIPKAHRVYVNRFNKALEEAKGGSRDAVKNLNAWKWYLRCQQRVPHFSTIISERVWDFLWKSQIEFGVRPKHIIMLSQDILSTGANLTDEQWLEYIRSLYLSGDTASAVQLWESKRQDISQEAQLFSTFYSTGIQLYATLGRPMKAQNVCYYALKKGADPKILIHVITAWANEKSNDAAVKSWGAYLKVRTLLGDDIDLGFFERVSNAFLDAEQPTMAMAVFKDLVAGLRGQNKFALETYHRAIGSIDQDQDPEVIEKKINEVSLATLLVLPKNYNNKYFFSSWIKQLLGQKRLDAAAMVIDLMYERNITPDAIHLNGLIGAWLRDENAQSRDKAEKLAWEMIRARIKHVQQRSNNQTSRRIDNAFRKVVQFDESDSAWSKPVRLERPMTKANAETFSLLFDYSERRANYAEFERLTSLMIGPAQLRLNIFIVNKLLMRELRNRTLGKFWQVYQDIKADIVPNLDTFSLLWQAAALHFAPTYEADKASPKSYPSSRQLFHDMEVWFRGLNTRDAKMAIEEFDSDLYAQIVKCFCYQMDIPGALCAMHGMYDLFQATPNNVSIRLITGLVARMLPRAEVDRSQTRGRTRFNQKLASSKSLLREVADLIETLEAKHKIALVETGETKPDDLEDVENDIAKRMRLSIITEFLLMMMQKTEKEGGNYIKTIRDVAAVMKVDLSQVNLELDSAVQ